MYFFSLVAFFCLLGGCSKDISRPVDPITYTGPEIIPHTDENGNRLPGTLLLNMLIKDEAVHLDRTLPKWAGIIDFWVIGVDDANSDESPEIIEKHLGHIPGEIVIVHFEGMGPTWSTLVDVGIEKYPEATHGILSDADFMPLQNSLDKMELDFRCSKHMFTIYNQDRSSSRKMDWIYRNIHGVKIERRTHQTVIVPVLPNQNVFQTLISLDVEERPGGYQDRAGGKNLRYIGFLEADLIDFPDDPRTIYYLGYAYYDEFMKTKNGDETSRDWESLEMAVEYFEKRLQLKGNDEERWFTFLKLGEIHERFYREWEKAFEYYKKCIEDDPERADPYFYVGQHFRLNKNPEKGVHYLNMAADLELPERSLFQWHPLYSCFAKLEFARAVNELSPNFRKITDIETALSFLNQINCEQKNLHSKNEISTLQKSLERKLAELQETEKDVENIHPECDEFRNTLDENLDSPQMQTFKNFVEFYDLNLDKLQKLDLFYSLKEFFEDFRTLILKYGENGISCRDFRKETIEFLRFIKSHNYFEEILGGTLASSWRETNLKARKVCR